MERESKRSYGKTRERNQRVHYLPLPTYLPWQKKEPELNNTGMRNGLGVSGKGTGGRGDSEGPCLYKMGETGKNLARSSDQGDRGDPELRETKCPIWRGEKGSISDESDSNEC